MKKFLPILSDILIILFAGFCVGLVNVLFAYYTPDMLNLLLRDILIAIIIGGTCRFSIIIIGNKRNMSLSFILILLFSIVSTGFIIKRIFFSENHTLRLVSVFCFVMSIVLYLGYMHYKLEKDLNFYLNKKKGELSAQKRPGDHS